MECGGCKVDFGGKVLDKEKRTLRRKGSARNVVTPVQLLPAYVDFEFVLVRPFLHVMMTLTLEIDDVSCSEVCPAKWLSACGVHVSTMMASCLGP